MDFQRWKTTDCASQTLHHAQNPQDATNTAPPLVLHRLPREQPPLRLLGRDLADLSGRWVRSTARRIKAHQACGGPGPAVQLWFCVFCAASLLGKHRLTSMTRTLKNLDLLSLCLQVRIRKLVVSASSTRCFFVGRGSRPGPKGPVNRQFRSLRAPSWLTGIRKEGQRLDY